MMLIAKGIGSDHELRKYSNITELQFNAGSGAAMNTTGLGLSTGVLYCVIVDFDLAGITGTITVNNGTPTSQLMSGASDSADLYFGRRSDGFLFNGKMREVGRWNRLLTSGEKTTLYNGGVPLLYPF
jgi:hypothetical protein